MLKQQNWVDQPFISKLLQRSFVPGMVNLRFSNGLIARHKTMGQSLELSRTLNQRWQPLDDEPSEPLPIVYASLLHTAHHTPLNESTAVSPTKHLQTNPDIQQTVNPKIETTNVSQTAVTQRSRPKAAATTKPTNQLGNAPANKTGAVSVSTPPIIQTVASHSSTKFNHTTLPVVQPVLADESVQSSTTERLADSSNLPIISINHTQKGEAIQTIRATNLSETTPITQRTYLTNVMTTNSNNPAIGQRREELPLKTAVSPTVTQTEKSALPISTRNTNSQPPQPPLWMQKRFQEELKKAATPKININNLVDKVEQQMMQRIKIQQERRGKQ